MNKEDEVSTRIRDYIPIVEFLGDVMGDHCEIVLHDATHVDNSIVAIKNGHVSNRKVGGSLTDLALKILKNKSYIKSNYLVNYSGKTRDGKTLRSSTLFIKDDDGEVIGLLCINMDFGQMVEARNIIDRMISGLVASPANGINLNGGAPGEYGVAAESCESARPTEDLHTSIEDLTSSIILSTLSEMEIPPDRMTPEEKIEVVKQLNDKGVFLIKGAVSEVASQLKVSEATMYRYLNKQQNGRSN